MIGNSWSGHTALSRSQTGAGAREVSSTRLAQGQFGEGSEAGRGTDLRSAPRVRSAPQQASHSVPGVGDKEMSADRRVEDVSRNGARHTHCRCVCLGVKCGFVLGFFPPHESIYPILIKLSFAKLAGRWTS